MLRKVNYLFVIFSLLTSILYAVDSPASWSVNQQSPANIDIKDADGNILLSQRINNLSELKKYSIKFKNNTFIAFKENKIINTHSLHHGSNYKLILIEQGTFQGQLYYLPESSALEIMGHDVSLSSAVQPTQQSETSDTPSNENLPALNSPALETRFNKPKGKYDNVDFSQVVCWRIKPNNLNDLELLDKYKNVVLTEPVRTQCGLRKLSHYALYFSQYVQNGTKKRKAFRFPRDSRDTADLEKSGFAEGTNLGGYRKYEYPSSLQVIYPMVNTGPSLYYSPATLEQEILPNEMRLTRPRLPTTPAKKAKYNPTIVLAATTQQNQTSNTSSGGSEFAANPQASKTKGHKRRGKYDDIDFSQVVCWRIKPNNLNDLELLDKYKNVVLTEPVRTQRGFRKLSHNALYFAQNVQNGIKKRKSFRVPRDSRDTADLEKSGFAEGTNSGGYHKYEYPSSFADLSQQDQDMAEDAIGDEDSETE